MITNASIPDFAAKASELQKVASAMDNMSQEQLAYIAGAIAALTNIPVMQKGA